MHAKLTHKGLTGSLAPEWIGTDSCPICAMAQTFGAHLSHTRGQATATGVHGTAVSLRCVAAAALLRKDAVVASIEQYSHARAHSSSRSRSAYLCQK